MKTLRAEAEPLLSESVIDDAVTVSGASRGTGSGTSSGTVSRQDTTAEALPDYDDVLERIGTGRFHYLLLLMCGWANAADAVELLSVSFIITSTAECELDLTSMRKGYVTAGMFAGMMLGGWLWGALADRYGRKYPLMTALLINAAFGFVSAFSTNFIMFMMCRVLSGVGVGGSIPIVFTYVCEFLPMRSRGHFLNLVAAFWMLGTVIAASFAWSIIGTNECDKSGLVNPSREELCELWTTTSCGYMDLAWGRTSAWRMFAASASFPAMLSVISLFFAPESPKYLLHAGRITDCRVILRRIADFNRNSRKDVENTVPEEIDLNFNLPQPPSSVDSTTGRVSCFGRMWAAIGRVLRSTVELFRGPTLRPTLVLSGIWALLSFGFYGLTLWMPNYFQHGGIDTHTSVYEISFYVALSNVPGNVFAYFATDWLGRRLTLAISMVASGVSVFSILEIHTTGGTTAFSCVFAGVSVAGWNALNILSAENFQTRQRAAAFGFLAAMGRIGAILGNIVFGEMSDRQPTLPLILTGAMLGGGGLLCFFLKETRNAHIL